MHRDISQSNIVITNPDENGGFSGMLIDLELGTTVEEGRNSRTGSQHMTGTLKYMAIEVVQTGFQPCGKDQLNLDHTYRHDLESFFYVLLATCISCGWEESEKPKNDPLRDWYIGGYDSIVRAKLGDMGLNGFETLILPKFSPVFECAKDLAIRLRDALFLRQHKLRIGTPEGDKSVLYDQMIEAFDKAIEPFAG